MAYRLAGEIKARTHELLASSLVAKDFGFCSQVRRAAESISSNIAEGHARYNPAEFANFLRYARASAAELRDRLPDGVNRGYYTAADIASLLNLLNRETAVLSGLRNAMRRLAQNRNRRT